jgi:hypothetical protein
MVYNLRFQADVVIPVEITSGNPNDALRELVKWPEVQHILRGRVQGFGPANWALAESGEKPEFRYEIAKCPLVKVERG